jgi:hypothetical protein
MTGTSPTKASRLKYTAYFCMLRNILFGFVVITFLGLIASTNTSAVTSISQSYTTSETIALDSIVSLKNNTSDQVIASTNSNSDSLLGVVIDANNSLLSLSNNQNNQVQVATSGTSQVLVSNINGDITTGDHITASPISGVGMKATDNVRIVGIAQGSLTSANGSQQTYTDKQGASHSALMGQIPVLINVSYYFKEPDKTLVPPALQNVANSLAGKTVNTLPIIISAAIFIITIIVVASIIYAMIRSSIISIGRNPLSQSAVYRNIVQLSGLVLIILGVGLVSIYLILTRM